MPGAWRNGRRYGLKIRCLTACGFESRRPHIPSGIYARPEQSLPDTELASGLCDSHLFAADNNKTVRSTIVGLLDRRSPSAVCFAVLSAVVAPIQRLAARPPPHVGKEPIERTPFIAEGDTATAVSWVRRVARIRASLLHTLPCFVRRRICVAVSLWSSPARWDCDGALMRFLSGHGCS